MKTIELLSIENRHLINKRSFKKDLLNSLFTDIPALSEIVIIPSLYGSYRLKINGIVSPLRENDDFKSYLIEINLKQSEIDLIKKCVPYLRGRILLKERKFSFCREKLTSKGNV